MRLGFEHSYAGLPGHFHEPAQPAPVASPRLLAWNAPLAGELGLDAAQLAPVAHLLFSGAGLAEDARPIALAYAGHQFGHFVPALGDGRALLLGELRDRDGTLRDVQLKGSGRTRWSRSGDGLAAVGPMLREYLISEAMHALGIPTTRSLAVVATGTTVLREAPQPGAVLTRIAASHVRVGTFEYFAARGDEASLRTLLEYSLRRHYPDRVDAPQPALEFLRAVSARQADLIAAWMGVGFIHGVMNTDNMAISGETIDYGPCAFMDRYDPSTVFSSIDHRGRYAFGNQGVAAQWNLARLAESLLPLLGDDRERAVRDATEVVGQFAAAFEAALQRRLLAKIGLEGERPEDQALLRDLLQQMQGAAADYTLTFRQLADAAADSGHVPAELVPAGEAGTAWLARWRERLAAEPAAPEARRERMRRLNPLFIPRNHKVEAALAAASERDDLAPFHTLLDLVQSPYDEHPGFEAFTRPAADDERVLQTFCGT